MSNVGFDEYSDYYKNMEIFTGQRIVKVLLENILDVDIWNDALPVKENLTFEYATAIDVADELGLKKAEGCTQLNQIKHYHLGENLIICRDSDYHYIAFLMKNIIEDKCDEVYMSSEYIFETIVHSQENILFFQDYVLNHFANRIHVHPSTLNTKAPWISEFYLNLSKIIYKPMLKLIYHDYILQPELKLDKIGFKKFNNIILNKIKYIPKRNIVDFNNFFKSKKWNKIIEDINTFEKVVDAVINKHDKCEKFDLVMVGLNQFNINDVDFYHFFRGHDIKDICQPIFEKYLDLVFDKEIDLKCMSLDEDNASTRRAELIKMKKEFDVLHETRNLKEHKYFYQTYKRLENLYE